MSASDLSRRLKRTVAAQIRAQQPLVEQLRSTETSRQLRRRVESLRVRRLLRTAGSADAALDRIVADALDSVHADRLS